MKARSERSLLRELLPVGIPLIALGIGCFFGLNGSGLFDLDEGLYLSLIHI